MLFQEFERFGVAAALEEVAQFGIERGRELLFELLDPFGDSLEPCGVVGGIAAAFFVGDDGETFAQRGSQVG